MIQAALLEPYAEGIRIAPLLGFNSERLDPLSSAMHLGNGYRAYNPVLMRFHCPDSFSPFGAGGVHSYAYCAGDPINRSDPTGHLSWQAWVGIGLGVLGLGLATFTAGSSIAAAGSVAAAIEGSAFSLATGTAGVVADATAIASGATEAVDPKASAILAWMSLATGLVGVSAGAARAGATIRGIHDAPIRPSGAVASRAGDALAHDVPSDGAQEAIENLHVLGYSVARRSDGSELKNELFYTFTDTTRGGRSRVVFVGHGTVFRGQGMFMNRTGFSDGESLANLLRNTYGNELANYSEIRLLVCHSASGSPSLMEGVARTLRGKTVVGYTDVVLLRGATRESFRSLRSLADELRAGSKDEAQVTREIIDRDLRVFSHRFGSWNPFAVFWGAFGTRRRSLLVPE